MPYPLDAIQEQMGLTPLTRNMFVQVAERMGLIHFIEMSKE